MIYILYLLFALGFKLPAAENLQEPPKVVVFDYGRVLGYKDDAVLVPLLSKTFQISPSDALAVSYSYHEAIRTGKSDEAFWTEYAKSMGKLLPKDWFAAWNKQMIAAVTPIPGMRDLVLELQTEGVQTAILSNTSAQNGAAIRAAGGYELFHPVILSYQVGLRKPDPKIFDLLLKELGRPPAECLFIDDKLINVEAARQKGIDSIQFLGVEPLIEELRTRGLLKRTVKSV